MYLLVHIACLRVKIEFSARLDLIIHPLTQAIVIRFCLHRLCQVPNPSCPKINVAQIILYLLNLAYSTPFFFFKIYF